MPYSAHSRANPSLPDSRGAFYASPRWSVFTIFLVSLVLVVLPGAFVAADLAGVTGLLLSAPVLATLRLPGRCVYRKFRILTPGPTRPP